MRALKVLVVVMGVLIVAGTVTLVALIVQRMGGAVPVASRVEAPPVGVEASLGQPPGTRILGMAGAEGRIALWVSRPEGERVLLLDPRSGRLAGEVRLGD
ncbi:DUF6476 family protein [Roseomonas sp. BN140053]|uniref:DUF6476 family protein n=1 Tax=Roseomonas sp. BN140053 TaxID=3391898 RepID=UPI0039E8C22C